MIYSLNRTTCFGQGSPSSGHQEPGYALYLYLYIYIYTFTLIFILINVYWTCNNGVQLHY